MNRKWTIKSQGNTIYSYISLGLFCTIVLLMYTVFNWLESKPVTAICIDVFLLAILIFLFKIIIWSWRGKENWSIEKNDLSVELSYPFIYKSDVTTFTIEKPQFHLSSNISSDLISLKEMQDKNTGKGLYRLVCFNQEKQIYTSGVSMKFSQAKEISGEILNLNSDKDLH